MISIKLAVLTVILTLTVLDDALGEPSYTYWQGGQKYYYNPYDYYYNRYYPQVSRKYDDNVYITDMYGRTTVKSGYDYLRGMVYSRSSCGDGVCGQNTQCHIAQGRAVCSCLSGHAGNPLTYCKKSECSENEHCASHQSCINDKCVNPCVGTCGVGANCDVRNHIPVCSCPRGFVGNPFTSCTKDPASECNYDTCGKNAECRVVGGTATCYCLPGYFGSPITGCRRECEINEDCSTHLACIDNKCQNPCSSQCGQEAICETVRNHAAVCKCPQGYFGNPFVSCRPECTSHAECPSNKPACYNYQCKNPCDGVCGIGANCELNGIKAICSCPKHLTGDPFVQCRPFAPSEICTSSTCGINAECEPGHRNGQSELIPVCYCRAGYTGDPLARCYPQH